MLDDQSEVFLLGQGQRGFERDLVGLQENCRQYLIQLCSAVVSEVLLKCVMIMTDYHAKLVIAELIVRDGKVSWLGWVVHSMEGLFVLRIITKPSRS